MLRQFSSRRILVFFLVDTLGTLGLFFLTVTSPGLLLRFGQLLGVSVPPLFGVGSAAVPDPATGEWHAWPVYFLVAAIWMFFFLLFSVYDGRYNASLRAELFHISQAVSLSTIVFAGALYFTYRETSRQAVVVFFVLDLLFLFAGRTVLWLVRRPHRSWARSEPRLVLVIGGGKVGQSVVEQLRKYAAANVQVVGYADDDPAKQGVSFAGVSVLGTLEQLPELCSAHRVHDAVVALPLRAHERLVQTCRLLQAQHVRVYVVPDLFALSFPNATLDGFGGIPVVDLGQPGINGWPRFLKRAFDVVVVLVGLVAISPLLLLIAVLVKLDSPGPVLYRQPRIGEDGRLFSMFKFRSMRTDTDPAVHQAHVTRLIRENLDLAAAGANGGNGSLKLGNDLRVTRVGKFIRKTSLDELPQLLNVLRGEMSLVGPRPPLPYEVDLYQDWHKRRLDAIPGMTGLWQVKGRNRVSFDEMVRMDLEYIEHQSFWLDLKLLALTPLAMVTGRGAG